MLSLADVELSKLDSEFRPFAYASIPKIPIKTWERVQRLDWACLCNASIDTDRTDQDRFYAAIDSAAQAYAASKESATGVVTLGDVWPFYDTSEVFRVTTHLSRVVFPTQQYVEHMRDSTLIGIRRFTRLPSDFWMCVSMIIEVTNCSA